MAKSRYLYEGSHNIGHHHVTKLYTEDWADSVYTPYHKAYHCKCGRGHHTASGIQ